MLETNDKENIPSHNKKPRDSLEVFDDLPDYVPARMLNEFVYCPRLAFIEWVEGEFRDNAYTVDGRRLHKRVDKKEDILKKIEDSFSNSKSSRAAHPSTSYKTKCKTDEKIKNKTQYNENNNENENEESTIHARSVLLSGEEIRAIARIDIVESDGEIATPVDYKRKLRFSPDGGLPQPDLIQLCLQGLILRENGFRSTQGILYYCDTKQRKEVDFVPALETATRQYLKELLNTASSKTLPPPLIDDPRCDGCSLVGICLPDETNALTGRLKEYPRKLVPRLDESLPLYVQIPGGRVGKNHSALQIKDRDRKIQQTARLMEISHLSLMGNVQVTTQAVRELCKRSIPITYFSSGGWFYGITTGHPNRNVQLRIQQFATAAEKQSSLNISRVFISSKILNCRTLLMRNHENPSINILKDLKELSKKALSAENIETLLGLEGTAARIYFSNFQGMLKNDPALSFHFDKRNRRPPKDPINAMLSFAYSLLTKDVTIKLLSVGFDPYMGFYHQPRYGRPSLALDLMEEFRPLIADSTVLTVVNNNIIRPEHFISGAASTNLTAAGRKRFLNAYSKRMNTLVTHPIFKYRISYNRIIEVQSRLLARHLLKELDSYPPFMTR